MRQDFLSTLGCRCPVKGRVCSPVAGAEALRVRFKLALFPLSVCFSFSSHWGFAPKNGSGEVLEVCVLTEV